MSFLNVWADCPRDGKHSERGVIVFVPKAPLGKLLKLFNMKSNLDNSKNLLNLGICQNSNEI